MYCLFFEIATQQQPTRGVCPAWVHGGEVNVRMSLGVLFTHRHLLPLVLRIRHGAIKTSHPLKLQVISVEALCQHATGGHYDLEQAALTKTCINPVLAIIHITCVS